MRRALSVLIVILCLAGTMLQAGEPTHQAAQITTGSVPTMYFSSQPNQCLYFPEGTQYQVYVYAPDFPGLSGVNFDLYLNAYSPIPEPIIYSTIATSLTYDTSSIPYHVELTWDSQVLDHTPIVNLLFLSDPQLQGTQYPDNIVFTEGITPIDGTGISTFAGCCVDCIPCALYISADNLVLAQSGATTTVPFEYLWSCYTYGSAQINVSDTQGWVTSFEPTVGGGIPCEYCIHPATFGSFDVTVPSGAQQGETTTVSITTSTGYTEYVTVEVEGPVTTEETTWGRIKSLYR